MTPPTVLTVNTSHWPMVELIYSGTPSDSELAEHRLPLLVPRRGVHRLKQTRQAMTAVFWLAPPSYPYAFVESVPEARTWARERLEA